MAHNPTGPSSSDSPTNRSLPGPSGTIQPPNLIRPSAIQNPLLRGAAMPGGAAGPTGLPPRAVPTQVSSSHEVDPFQAQLHKLRQEQAAQEQLLYSQFQAKISKLQEKHEWEMQQHLQQLLREQQQRAAAVAAAMRLEEERRASPPSVAAQPSGVSLNEKLEALKNKDERSQSAVASSEVKLKLQEFVLSKRQRESSAPHSQGPSSGRPGPIRTGSPGSPRQWHSALRRCYEDELYPPLRKTASEPNLKIRLKQRLERSSPLRARTRTPTYPKDLLKRRAPHNSSKSESSAGSTPDSGPSSPPSVANPISQSSSGSTVQEEMSGHDSGYGGCVPPPDLTNHPLFTSPSLPNISLGRPPGASLWAAQEGPKLPTVSETSPRMPIPLQIANMYFNSSSDSEQSTSPSTIQKQVEILEQQGQQIMGATGFYPTGPITDAEVAQARLAKTSPRPLNRTHSAPLPLGHPMLQPGAASIAQLQAQYEQILREQLQHSLLKQQLRATVLTRAGHLKQQSSSPSSSQICSSSSDEEHHSGAAKHQHPPLPHPEVIDLTECGHSSAARSSLPSSPPTGSRRLSRHSSEDNQGIGSHSPPQTSRALSAQQRNSLSRPLSRALSSPLVNMISPPTAGTIPGLKDRQHAGGTGIAFDPVMLKHGCVCGNNAYHPEHSGRLQSAWARLQDTTLLTRCERLRPRKATMEELQTCHTEAHTLIFGTSSLSRQGKMDISQPLPPPLETGFVYLPCGGVGVDSDTTWDELHTSTAARTAAGCTVELAMKVAMGELRNGFALVRPPGHHAEPEQAMGFCYFNNIAIAAKQLRCRLRMERILIVDWDVHHGNGTQSIFYADHHVLVISIHRYDDGNFFPGTGGPVECGVGDGLGFNVNIPWAGNLNPPCGDAEYLAAFRAVVMPIAKEFNPEIVLVSAGFDAVRGHPAPLGGYEVSPACFAFLTRQLQQLANGKVVLVLEGGYDLLAVCDCVQECVSALLGDPLPPIEKSELAKKPSVAALETLQKTIAIQSHHWPLLRSFAYCVDQSALEAMTFDQARMEKLLSIGVDSETCNAMASLSVDPMDMKRSEAMEEGGGFGVCGSPGPSDQSIPSGSTEEPMEDDSKD